MFHESRIHTGRQMAPKGDRLGWCSLTEVLGVCAAPACQIPACCWAAAARPVPLLLRAAAPAHGLQRRCGRWPWLGLCVLCPSGQRAPLGAGPSERLWFPVWLEEADVECPCPVLEDALLGDEAVVAALAAPLVGNVHGALVRTQRFVVVIRYWKMIRIPVEKRK